MSELKTFWIIPLFKLLQNFTLNSNPFCWKINCHWGCFLIKYKTKAYLRSSDTFALFSLRLTFHCNTVHTVVSSDQLSKSLLSLDSVTIMKHWALKTHWNSRLAAFTKRIFFRWEWKAFTAPSKPAFFKSLLFLWTARATNSQVATPMARVASREAKRGSR